MTIVPEVSDLSTRLQNRKELSLRMSKLINAIRSINKPLQNTGSVARDHLANERTFLSWTRTGLGFIALGVACAKLDTLEALSPVLSRKDGPGPGEKKDWGLRSAAFALVGSGTGCLTYGTGRYFAVFQALKKGMFRPNMGGVMLVTLTSGLVAVGGAFVVGKEEMERRRHVS
ncbi:hypothetical protein NHQ30_001627 [Ciborinia camelliae]|nr:hypothetical protein NHQ30_001627 [Ciborinia camelliae]